MASSAPTLRSLIAIPEVGRTLSASLVGRLAFTAIGLLLILRVRAVGGGFAEGGAASGAFALGIAAAGPLVGRAVDRHGQRAVLLPCAAVCGSALLVVALSPAGTPIGVLIALAGLAGVSHPPLSGSMRALWPELVPADRRHAILALEAAGVELTFILGPLVLVGGVAAATSPAVGLCVAAAVLVGGTVAFATSPSSLRWRPSGAPRRLAGALASPGLLTLVVACACMGASFGAIEVATTAHADEHGAPALVGPLLAVWAAGSLMGGLATARSRAPDDPHRRLVALLAATAAADLLVALAPGPATLAPALLLAGACIAPAFATLYGMVSDTASAGTLTESYTWVATGITAGAAAGAALGGAAVDAVSTHAAMAGGAGAVALATLVTGLARRVLGGGAPAVA